MILSFLPTLLLFFYYFLYFILQVKPQEETSQGALPLHKLAGNVGNGYQSRSASFNSQERGYGKPSAVDLIEANTGLFHPSFFVLWFLTRMPLKFYRLIPHGANRLHTSPPPLRRRHCAASPRNHPSLPSRHHHYDDEIGRASS